MDRLGALSDGVFAIVLTLLVLELKIPEVPPGEVQALRADLLGQVPHFVAWVVSFALVARFWVMHHTVLRRVERCHLGTVVLNFCVLGAVSLVPFGSALIGTYEFELVPVVLFSGIMASNGLFLGLFARHLARSPRLHAPGLPADVSWHWRYHVWGIPLFAVCAAAFAWAHHPGAALATWLVEPLIALAVAGRGAGTQPSIFHGATDEREHPAGP